MPVRGHSGAQTTDIERSFAMVICSFLGHDRLYDDNVYTKLSKAVRNIARNNDEIEFRFYLHNKFYSMCYDAALEAKQFYTEKKITLKFFVDKDESESFLNRLKHDTLYVPQCIVDQVEILPEFEVKDSKNARMIKFHKTMYWLLKGSTHLISYLSRTKSSFNFFWAEVYPQCFTEGTTFHHGVL